MSGAYNDTTHTYSWRGDPWPSVTQVLKDGGIIDARFYTPEAAARGTAVHAVTDSLDRAAKRGRAVSDAEMLLVHLGQSTVLKEMREDIGGEVDAYRAFVKDSRIKYAGIEIALFECLLRFGGRPDRLVKALHGESGILEIKTGAEQEWHGAQTALYQMLRPMGSRWVVYLQKTGRYKLRRMVDADDYRVGQRAVLDWWKMHQHPAA